MYKIVSFRYESVIQKNFEAAQKKSPPPQSRIRSYGLGETTYLGPTVLPFQIYYLFNIMNISLKHV